MRLISIAPLQHLITYGLPRSNIGLVRSYLAFGEKLKFVEQKLNFMKKCKTMNIFPAFILNNSHINSRVLFPSHNPTDFSYFERRIRTLSLNQNIKCLYTDIRQLKHQLYQYKQDIHHHIADQFMFHEIMNVFDRNNEEIKHYHKHRLQEKLNWLLLKYYPHQTSRATDANTQSSDCRVTVIDCDTEQALNITPAELDLLSLGPGFALSNKVDNKMIKEVEVNIAQCAYKMRWKQHLSSQDNQDNDQGHESSAYVQAKKNGCPFQCPFIAAPPNDDPQLEMNLKLLCQFVTGTMKEAQKEYTSNLTRSQLSGLISLKQKSDVHV